jgi:hypothetical protein
MSNFSIGRVQKAVVVVSFYRLSRRRNDLRNGSVLVRIVPPRARSFKGRGLAEKVAKLWQVTGLWGGILMA